MPKLRLYLDNCCFNRKYDDQSQIRVYLETQATTLILDEVRQGRFELVWSYILDEENNQNRSLLKKRQIQTWKDVALLLVGPSQTVVERARVYAELGLKAMDALHVACAVEAACDVFITTDKKILNKTISGIRLLNPCELVDFDKKKRNG